MDNRTTLYVSRKSLLTWLSVLCMTGSVVARIILAGMKGVSLWSQIILPITACILLVLIVLISGKERFYKTAIPVWMLAVYYFFVFNSVDYTYLDFMVGVLYAIMLVFIAGMYTQITSEKPRRLWMLHFLLLIPPAALLYLNRFALNSEMFLPLLLGRLPVEQLGNYRALLADILMTLGMSFLLFSLRLHPAGEYHPTWGDRSDGRRIRSEAPINQILSYIMVTRNTATNKFSSAFEITHAERYIRQKRKEGMTNFGLVHVLLAAYCRSIARYPKINRFISGQRIYTHGNDLQFCMTVKKEMTTDAPESVIKVHLSPWDTAQDVYRKVNKEVEIVKNTPLDSKLDKTIHTLTMLPGILLKFTVWLLRTLDYFGLIPGTLLELSPFHGSVFFTSMGSLGIPPVYHHLYDFGNIPVFNSFGCKRRTLDVQEDGTVVQRKYLDCKFTLDERIVDGFYYATFFKHFRYILHHPEILDGPPDEVRKDID